MSGSFSDLSPENEQLIVNPADNPARTALFDVETGAPFFVSPAGGMEVAELIRLVGDNFESGPLLPNIWETSVTGSGTGAAVTGEAVLTTGTTADSTSEFQTVNRSRFVTATFNKAHMAVQLPSINNSNVVREWGMFDPVTPIVSGDGLFFRVTDGDFTLVRRKAGVDSTVGEGGFNGGNTIVKDNDVHTYEIIYNAGSALFYQDRKIIHKVIFIDAVGYETTHLKLGMSLRNINGNTTNNIMRTRGFSCSRIGSAASVPDKFVITASGTDVIKNSPGILSRIVILDTGVAGASIEFFDSTDSSSNLLFEIDLTETLIPLEFGFELNNGLSYSAVGASFTIVVVFE